MRGLLEYLDARFGEASTYASLAAMLTAAHVSVDPGVLHTLTAWGIVAAGALAVLLREGGSKPAAQIAADVLAAVQGGTAAKAAMVLLLAGLGLGACQAPPQTTVAGVAVALTAADQVALVYVDLPPCGAGAATACSDPAIVARIKAAAASAYADVQTAEASGNAADLSLAESAVAALSALIPAAK